MSTIVNKISQLKLNAVAAFNLGYRIINGICINPEGEEQRLGLCPKKANVSYSRFSINKGKSEVFVHLLAAYQKYGNIWLLGKLQVRHLNTISTDNRLENIELGTSKENYDDLPKEKREQAYDNGLRKWTKSKRFFTEEQVKEIREKSYSQSIYSLAQEYGSSWRTLKLLISGVTYKDVDGIGNLFNNKLTSKQENNLILAQSKIKKLSNTDIEKIPKEKEELSYSDLAKKYGVCVATIKKICIANRPKQSP